MNNSENITENRGISTIWTLPIIALAICAWLIWSSFQNSGIDITIIFEDASGIEPGKTQVMAKGIPVGLVKKIIPDLDNNNIKAVVEMEQEISQYLVEDTLFWIVRPELSASSVQGLDTIFSGSYIGIQVGSSTTRRLMFTGLHSAPPISSETPGLHLRLTAEALGSIQVGTGIYYRNIQIGNVQRYQLEGNESVLIDLFIDPEYTHLVREGSRFCNASGLQISGKLTKLKVHIESLASLLRGGILLHTPEPLRDTRQVENGHIFSLYPDYESANYGLNMTLTLSSGQDIVEGDTKVMYRGLEAGFVKEITINNSEKLSVTAHILLDPRAELILRENTKFWLVKPEVSAAGIKNLRLLLAGPHITFQPGTGKFQDHFEILPEPPLEIPLRKGKSFILTSKKTNNISANSPVYYKNIPVGEVVNTDIEVSGGSVFTTIFIYKKYLPLVSKKSIFWINSGLEVEAGFDKGFAMSTGPLAQILYGGISFRTIPSEQSSTKEAVEDGDRFSLHDSYDSALAATPALQAVGKKFRITAKDAQSLSVGSPILHKNIEIGEVLSLRFSKDKQSIVLDCFVKEQYLNFIHENTRFYNASGIQLTANLDAVKLQTGSLQSLLAGGIGCVNPEPGKKMIIKKSYPLYENLEAALQRDKIKLTFYLEQPYGLKVGSQIQYKNITIGEIEDISFSEDLKTVIGRAKINSAMASLFTTGTIVWVERIELGLAGIKNLETMLTGSYLHFLPGEGNPSRSFKVLNEPPRTRIASQNGLGLVLETSHLGSISKGSPIYYRQIQVGEVTDFDLSATFQKVYIYATILDKYRGIIRENTKFWNVSGAQIKGGLFSGLQITTGSLESILRGGIALATPDTLEILPAAADGYHFILHDEAEKTWIDWNPNIILLDQEPNTEIFRETE